MTFFGGAGAAGGWSGGGNWNSQRPNSLKRSTDGWDDEELGSVYNHRVVMRLYEFMRPYRFRLLMALIGTLGFAFDDAHDAARRRRPDPRPRSTKNLGGLNRWGFDLHRPRGVLGACSTGCS